MPQRVGPSERTPEANAVRRNRSRIRTAEVSSRHTSDPSLGSALDGGFDHAELDLLGSRTYAVLVVDEATGVACVRIVEARSQEVIQEIPAQELLQFAGQVQSYLDARRKRQA